MRRHRNRSRGFSMIEALVAAVILAVAIVAMFSSWSTAFKQNETVTQITAAEEVDRAILETAKAYGAANLPLGTYNSSTATGTWTGAYIPATGWTSAATAYFDSTGTQLTSSTGAYYSASVTITDSPVLQGSGTSYTLESATLRSIVSSVTLVSSGATVFTMATSVIQGGM